VRERRIERELTLRECLQEKGGDSIWTNTSSSVRIWSPPQQCRRIARVSLTYLKRTVVMEEETRDENLQPCAERFTKRRKILSFQRRESQSVVVLRRGLLMVNGEGVKK
jgi:hypothetical protein